MLDTMPQTDSRRTRTEQVMDIIHQRIERRVLVPGARLPSVRAMADSCGFSKSTVVEAYDRLAAQGVIRARAGAGFYVAAPLAPLAVGQIEAQGPRDIDPVWLLRQASEGGEGVIYAGSGMLPAGWLADEGMRKALRGAARGDMGGEHGGLLGHEPMRQLISRRMAEQGLDCVPLSVRMIWCAVSCCSLAIRCCWTIRAFSTLPLCCARIGCGWSACQ